MKKICLISPVPPPYGGIANWTHLMNNFAEKTQFDIKIIQIDTSPSKGVAEGRSMFDRIVISGIVMLKKNKELKIKIRNELPDVIHITTSGQFGILRDIMLLKIAKRKNIPTVYHIRFGRIPEIAESNTKEWNMIKKAILLSSVTIAIDQLTCNIINKHLPDINCVYIPNPVDLSSLPILSEYNLENNYIMYLGWVIQTKGIEELLTAWENILKKYPDNTLMIVGPYNEEYMKKLRNNFSLQNVIFTGEKKHDKAMLLLKDADIFVLPSHSEGFPNVIIEAMALKKAIIATSVGAIPEMLVNDCGIVISPKSSKDIETAIISLIEDSSRKKMLGENAYTKAVSEYDIENVFAQYKKIWNDIKS